MSITRHRSRIRPSRAKLRILMMRTTTEARFSMAGRRRYTSRLPINPTTACHSISRPHTTLIPSSLIPHISVATRGHDTWGFRGRRTTVPVLRPTAPCLPCILL